MSPCRLRMVEHYWIPTGDAEVQLRSTSRTLTMRGGAVKKVLPLVLPLLDGTRTEEQIVGALAGKLEASPIRAVIKLLGDKDLLEKESGGAAVSAEDLAELATIRRYFGSHSQNGTEMLAALRRAHVLVVRGGAVQTPLASTLAHCGLGRLTLLDDDPVHDFEACESVLLDRSDVGRPRALALAQKLPRRRTVIEAATEISQTVAQWRERLAGITFAITVTGGPSAFCPWLEAFNEAAIAEHVPWTTLALLGRSAVQIGPLVRPEVSACRECMVSQLRRSLSFLDGCRAFERLAAELGETSAVAGPGAPVAEVAASFLAIEVLRAVGTGQDPVSTGAIVTLDLETMATSAFAVPKVPRCTACGPARNSPRMRIWS